MLKWKVVFVLYCALVLYLSSLSPNEIPDTGLEVSDKVLHLIEYALMGILAWGGFGRGSAGFPWALFAFCTCFGIVDECWQDWWDKGRASEVWDVAMDGIGAFVGLLISMVFWKR